MMHYEVLCNLEFAATCWPYKSDQHLASRRGRWGEKGRETHLKKITKRSRLHLRAAFLQVEHLFFSQVWWLSIEDDVWYNEVFRWQWWRWRSITLAPALLPFPWLLCLAWQVLSSWEGTQSTGRYERSLWPAVAIVVNTKHYLSAIHCTHKAHSIKRSFYDPGSESLYAELVHLFWHRHWFRKEWCICWNHVCAKKN